MPELHEEIAKLLEDFSDKVLLIGGFAVNHYGYTRNTLDIDVMVASSQVKSLRKVFVNAGFTKVEEGQVAIHFSHPGNGFRVDVLSVEAETFQALVANAEPCSLTSDIQIRTTALNDLLALKIHAVHQNPSRKWIKMFRILSG